MLREARIMWKVTESEISPEDVVYARISDGMREIEIMANAHWAGRVLTLRECHVQGAGRNRLGIAALRQIAAWVRECLDVDELRIEGATRTTGAGPGRRPAPIVFR